MENQQGPTQYNQPPQIIKKGMSAGAAIVLGLSGIIIAAIIAGAIIFSSGAKTVRDIDFESFHGLEINVDRPNNDMSTYADDKYGFSFDYPNTYTIAKNNEGEIRITSKPIPEVNEEKCNAIQDEQERAHCMNPDKSFSPNISIAYQEGNPELLWNEIKRFEFNEYPDLETDIGNWKHYWVSGEFGGVRTYGLFLNDVLLTASYSHQDSGGGYQFSRSEESRLSQLEQKQLLESILQSFKL